MATMVPVLTSPSQRTPNTVRHLPPNVSNVVLGNLHIKPWYPSFYPEEMLGGSGSGICALKDEAPPGEVIYEDAKGGFEIREVDGEGYKLYAQNLSLFAKLFLETKSVFFDSSTFLYYTLVLRAPDAAQAQSVQHSQVVGFFSKEKMSWDNNNIACILVFPPWQRRGLGQILIAASYELGRREGRFGGPERPLSALGQQGYVAFWCAEVARYMLDSVGKRPLSVKQISEATYILPEDVVAALREMNVCETRGAIEGRVFVKKEMVRLWAEKKGVNLDPLVNAEAFTKELEISDEESMEEASE